MKTHILQFWNSFHINKPNPNLGSGNNVDDFLTQITKSLKKIHKDLDVLLVNIPPQKARLYFIAKGRTYLKIIISEILASAPIECQYEFRIGIPPWQGSFVDICTTYKFLGPNVVIYQIYFDIIKIYRTSRKINLVLYVEKNRRIPRYIINTEMKTFLLLYLGDEEYYKNIAHIKISLTKFKSYTFAPISQLKRVLEYKFIPLE